MQSRWKYNAEFPAYRTCILSGYTFYAIVKSLVSSRLLNSWRRVETKLYNVNFWVRLLKPTSRENACILPKLARQEKMKFLTSCLKIRITLDQALIKPRSSSHLHANNVISCSPAIKRQSSKMVSMATMNNFKLQITSIPSSNKRRMYQFPLDYRKAFQGRTHGKLGGNSSVVHAR